MNATASEILLYLVLNVNKIWYINQEEQVDFQHAFKIVKYFLKCILKFNKIPYFNVDKIIQII